jgi:O-methyltransferase involved in polyketide biosynthesis
MAEPENAASAPRDYSTISPSAKALLLLKAQTDLPFARHAAELLFGAESHAPSTNDLTAQIRRAHFVDRARSLDAALATELSRQRHSVLEIASGFSFRGLAMTARDALVYFDTDLLATATAKSALVAQLHPAPLEGVLRVVPLNALDREAFRNLLQEIPRGPVAIVHEGLLMYLDEREKALLAETIREALRARGGVWITADVYIRGEEGPFRDERWKTFLKEHRVEENKFADWKAAEAFFETSGFAIESRLAPTPDGPHLRETWTLRPLP